APKVAATWPSSTSTWRSTSDSPSARPKASEPPSQAALTKASGSSAPCSTSMTCSRSTATSWILDTTMTPPDDRPGAGRGGTMIARIWKGAVRQQDGDAYARYMQETGVAGYAESPGNRGVWMLRRDVDGRTEFVMFTLWDSLEAVKAFAGDDYE